MPTIWILSVESYSSWTLPLRTNQLARTYATPNEVMHPWSIVDAAMATSAAPTYFLLHAIEYKQERYEYEDAGVHGVNNPSRQAYNEWERMEPKPRQPLHCFLSIGTGLKVFVQEYHPKGRNKVSRAVRNLFTPLRRLKALVRILKMYGIGVQMTHETVERLIDNGKLVLIFISILASSSYTTISIYFRFDPDGIGHIPLHAYRANQPIEDALNTLRRRPPEFRDVHKF